MSFFCRLSRRHYWCTPHRSADKRLVQVCYECGAERPAREIQDEFAMERYNHAIAYGKAEAAILTASYAKEESANASSTQEQIAVGQTRARKFSLVK